jgi:DNA repair exonuclease SbcCD ATPase subunit
MTRDAKRRVPAAGRIRSGQNKEERLLNEMTRLFNDLAILQRQTAKQKADLETANRRLNAALAEVKRLQGLLPICAACKRIRDQKGEWHAMEEYIQEHSEAEFSHGICPQCAARLYPGDGG